MPPRRRARARLRLRPPGPRCASRTRGGLCARARARACNRVLPLLSACRSSLAPGRAALHRLAPALASPRRARARAGAGGDDDDDDEDDAAGGVGGAGGKQNRNEKKARKALLKLGLKPVPAVARVTVEKSKQVRHAQNGVKRRETA